MLRGAEGAPPLSRVDVVQPVLFALMVSLAALCARTAWSRRRRLGHPRARSPPPAWPAR
ncbi:hypothetical protein LT493_00475 [Streptomyces tricolor]|nr:hypothetical protein [Streptomyces tricolor]